MQTIELLAPAKDAETGIAAIDCGADAVYIGAPRFGAREAAGNTIEEIERLIRYAHLYWARVYVTLNTLLRDEEISEAVGLAHQIYDCGADALIIQDVGLLECGLPPIPLIASTQMHNNTPEKVAFLEKVGFRRAILARELSLEQIRAIRQRTNIELESFIHGALCVGYSGQCYLSCAIGGRSGNRGQCAQPCRLPYALIDRDGRNIEAGRHLLSIRDLNLTGSLRGLLAAGVSSLKIEGRLKDKSYVMNVVAHYRRELDHIMNETGQRKSSSGRVLLDFDPDPNKTFNRGFTSYFLTGERARIGANDTPKMIGELMGEVRSADPRSFVLPGGGALHNGDGICFFNDANELAGTLVSRVDGSRIFPARMDGIKAGRQIYRNRDHEFLGRLDKSRTQRKMGVRIYFYRIPAGYRVELLDEDDVSAGKDCICETQPAQKPEAARDSLEKQMRKLNETEFICDGLEANVNPVPFFPVSALNDLRRNAVECLRAEREKRRPFIPGGIVPNSEPYPEGELSFSGNVLNRMAEAFYRRHGVSRIEPAAEIGLDMSGRKVMTSKYCIKYQLDACPREGESGRFQEPLYLVDEAGHRLQLVFDCADCRMEVIFEPSADEDSRD